MIASFVTSTVIGWLLRRLAELGGLLIAAAAVDPGIVQSLLGTVGALLTGNWQDINLGTLVGLATTVGGLIWNGRSTFAAHTTVDGQRVPAKALPPSKKIMVEEVARTEIRRRPRTIFDVIGERFGW